MKKSLDIVVHEIGHDEEMDDLRGHEPISYILGKRGHGSISVELSIGEDPEYNEENS